MAHVKNHDYHFKSISVAFYRVCGSFRNVVWSCLPFHGNGPWLLLIGFVGILYVRLDGGRYCY